MACHYCGQQGDLRPYGPRGEMICHPCMKADPEREAEAKRQFFAQLEASGPTPLLDGSEVGPYPVEHHPELKKGGNDNG